MRTEHLIVAANAKPQEQQQLPSFVRLPSFGDEPSQVQVAGQAQQGFCLSVSGLTVLLQLSTFSPFLLGSSQPLQEKCYLFFTGGETEAQRFT